LIKNLIIKKIIAAAMLIVFAFSITPTIFFHNWLANHTDSVNKNSQSNKDQVGKKLFNCHCDNIVAESPFTDSDYFKVLPAQPIFSNIKAGKPAHFSSSQPVSYSLRGPPLV
jgi:hypothetical protein